MKINSLKVNGFGKLENKEMEFTDGINVIVGKNEAGKSTLLKFITSMFYGASKNKNGKLIPDFDRYKPWKATEYSGKINYELENGEQYEVFREFKKKSPVIYNSVKDDITKEYQIDKNKENSFFIEQTGVTEENFFSTSVSEQENVKLSTNMKNAVIQKLSNIITTGKENTSYKKAIEKLNKSQLEEIGSARSSGRPINQIEEAISKIEQEKKDIEEYKEKKYQVEEKKQNIQADLEDNEAIIDLLRKQKINLEKTQIEEEKNKIFKKVLEENLQNQKRLEDKIENLSEERKRNIQSSKIVYYVCILAIVLITIISTIIIKKNIILAANILPVIAIVAYTTIRNKKRKKNKNSSKKIYQEKTILKEELERLRQEYNKKETEVNQRQEEILKKQKIAEEEITLEFIKKLESETIQDILSTKYERIVEFIDEKEREKAEYKINEKKIEVDNENIIKKLEELVEIDETLEKLYERKEELTELNTMYEIAKEEIENSYQEMKENITPEFIEELKNILAKVTDGKYTNIYLDSENNLLIETENGQYMPIEMLSIGTIDLIYLALRISATKEITQEKMPIILDESFAYYDEDRMRRILKYLATLEKYQILIFTCSEREKQILEHEKIQHNVIQL